MQSYTGTSHLYDHTATAVMQAQFGQCMMILTMYFPKRNTKKVTCIMLHMVKHL